MLCHIFNNPNISQWQSFSSLSYDENRGEMLIDVSGAEPKNVPPG